MAASRMKLVRVSMAPQPLNAATQPKRALGRVVGNREVTLRIARDECHESDTVSHPVAGLRFIAH
jgi:hypothetical protein